MVTAQQCLKKYGPAEAEKAMTVFTIPSKLKIPHIPAKIYCNKDLIGPLCGALENIVNRGLTDQVKTWDGCFNIRKKRGAVSASLHSWGIAVDINAAWNGFGKTPTMSRELVACFTDAGFDWGGKWTKPDGMHFQLSKI